MKNKEIENKIERVDYFLSRLEFLIKTIDREDGVNKKLKKMNKSTQNFIENADKDYDKFRKSGFIIDRKNSPLVVERLEEHIYSCYSEIEKIKTEEKQLEFFVREAENILNFGREYEFEIQPLKRRYKKISTQILEYQKSLYPLFVSLEQYLRNIFRNDMDQLGLTLPLNELSWWNEEFENSWFEVLRLSVPKEVSYPNSENLRAFINETERRLDIQCQEKENVHSTRLERHYKQESVMEWFSNEINFLEKWYSLKTGFISIDRDGSVQTKIMQESKKNYFFLRLREIKNNLELTLAKSANTRFEEENERLKKIVAYQKKIFEDERENIIKKSREQIEQINKEQSPGEYWKEKWTSDRLNEERENKLKKLSEIEEKEKSWEKKIAIYKENLTSRKRKTKKINDYSINIVLEQNRTKKKRIEGACLCVVSLGIISAIFFFFFHFII